jgi:hypothetical protein
LPLVSRAVKPTERKPTEERKPTRRENLPRGGTRRRNKTTTFEQMFEQKLGEHMSARGFVNLTQLAEVLRGVAKPKSAPVLGEPEGEPELQAMARREFAVSSWGLRRLGAALALTQAEIDKLSRYYFGLN